MSASVPNAVSPCSPVPRYQPLVIVLTAAVAGILLDRFWPLPLCAWWTMAAGGLAIWLTALAAKSSRELFRNFVLLMAAAATAGAWHHCRWRLFAGDDLGCYARRKAQPVCVDVVALGAPRAIPPSAPDPLQMMPAGDCWRINVDSFALRNGADWQPVSGRATLLVRGRPPAIQAGDRLRCFGGLSAPPGPQNPGAIDRAAYLRADRVRSRIRVETPECLSIIQSGSPWTPARLLDRLRTHGNRMLARYLDPQQAELAAAVLLGLREELDSGRNEAFLTTGTIHILSISGLHVGILAGAFSRR
jgi:competence protein ComEC